MNNLFNLISSIELAIRYLLSGVAITAIYLFSLSEENLKIKWDQICKCQAPALFLAVALGFAVFTLYRILYWVIGDCIAWRANASPPSLDRCKPFGIHFAFAKFLLWRRTDNTSEKISGYLHYRWAVVHFTFIFALALAFYSIHCEPDSLMENWQYCAGIASLIFIIAALRQSCFLFRVERALYAIFRGDTIQLITPSDSSKC